MTYNALWELRKETLQPMCCISLESYHTLMDEIKQKHAKGKLLNVPNGLEKALALWKHYELVATTHENLQTSSTTPPDKEHSDGPSTKFCSGL